MEPGHDGHDARPREPRRPLGIGILQHIPAGVVQLDTDYRLVLANATARRYIDMLKRSSADERVLALGGRPIEALVTPRTDALPHKVALEGLPRRIFAIWTHALPVTYPGGGWVLLMQEMTAEHHRRGQQAQQKELATIEPLVAGIAHEFSTLLYSIVGYAELLQMQVPHSQSFQDYLEAIAQWGHHGIKMTRYMLDFSGQPLTQFRPHDMLRILKTLLPQMEHALPASIRMVLNSAPGTYLIDTDVALMLQLLLNLIMNACDAMPDGGELRFVLSHLTLNLDDLLPCPNMRHGEWVQLTVSDTGRGMSPAVKSRLFDPCYTTPSGRQTDLGLTHVSSIVKQHDGYITVESQQGRGTVITLYFPSRRRSVDAIIEATPEEEVPRGRGETLVVADSDFSNREALRLTLRYLGYDVLAVANGREVLAVCDAQRDAIALVLTALVPTARGSLAFVSALRQRHPDVKVIALVQTIHWTARHDLLARGATTCLRQPPDLPLLAQAVSQALSLYD